MFQKYRQSQVARGPPSRQAQLTTDTLLTARFASQFMEGWEAFRIFYLSKLTHHKQKAHAPVLGHDVPAICCRPLRAPADVELTSQAARCPVCCLGLPFHGVGNLKPGRSVLLLCSKLPI